MTNPYDAPVEVQQANSKIDRNSRLSVYGFAVFGIVIGCIFLRPIVVSRDRLLDVLAPNAMWELDYWWRGFAFPTYLLFAAVVAAFSERQRVRFLMLSMPIWLLPLLPVSVLIVVVTCIDFPNILSGQYAWSENLFTLFMVAFCPITWSCFVLSAARSLRSLRNTTSE